jgi:hypothetical protein
MKASMRTLRELVRPKMPSAVGYKQCDQRPVRKTFMYETVLRARLLDARLETNFLLTIAFKIMALLLCCDYVGWL